MIYNFLSTFNFSKQSNETYIMNLQNLADHMILGKSTALTSKDLRLPGYTIPASTDSSCSEQRIGEFCLVFLNRASTRFDVRQKSLFMYLEFQDVILRSHQFAFIRTFWYLLIIFGYFLPITFHNTVDIFCLHKKIENNFWRCQKR